MYRFTVLLVFIYSVNALYCQCKDGSTFTREQAWDCVENVVDTDSNQKIDPMEIEAAKAKYLYFYEKLIGWIIGPTTVHHIQATCDSNGDGLIDSNDYDAMKNTCMPYYDPKYPGEKIEIDALCKFKGFCDRAAGMLNKKVY